MQVSSTVIKFQAINTAAPLVQADAPLVQAEDALERFSSSINELKYDEAKKAYELMTKMLSNNNLQPIARFLEKLRHSDAIALISRKVLEVQDKKCCLIFLQHFYSREKIDLFMKAALGQACLARTYGSQDLAIKELQVFKDALIEFEKQQEESLKKQTLSYVSDVIRVKDITLLVLEYLTFDLKDLQPFKKTLNLAEQQFEI